MGLPCVLPPPSCSNNNCVAPLDNFRSQEVPIQRARPSALYLEYFPLAASFAPSSFLSSSLSHASPTTAMGCPLHCKHVIDLPGRAYFTQRTPSYISTAFEHNSHNIAASSTTPLSRGQCYIFAESSLDPEVVALQSQGAVVYRADWVAQCLAKNYTVPVQEWVFDDFTASQNKKKSSSFSNQYSCTLWNNSPLSPSSTLVDVKSSTRAPDTPTPITGLLKTLEVNSSSVPRHQKKLPVQFNLSTTKIDTSRRITGLAVTRKEMSTRKHPYSVDDRTSGGNAFPQGRGSVGIMKGRDHHEAPKHHQTTNVIDTFKMSSLSAIHSSPRRPFKITHHVTKKTTQRGKRALNEHWKMGVTEMSNAGMKSKTIPTFMFDDTLSELLTQSKRRRVLGTWE